MPEKPEKEKKEEKSKGVSESTKWVVGVVVSLITLVSPFVFQWANEARHAHATETAEARLTVNAPTVTPSMTPSLTTMPTFTPTEAPATSTPTPTVILPTNTPTSTPIIPGEKYCVDIDALNVRTGPGTVYEAVGKLTRGDCLAFDGYIVYDGPNYWLRISPNQVGFTQLGGLWVWGQYLRPQDFMDRLPTLEAPPLPATPTPTPAG